MELKSTTNIDCPGCGVCLPKHEGEFFNHYNASEECYAKYSELTYYTLNQQDNHFIHQHAVDTYAAQHYGGRMKPITIAFALIGLYFAIEHGYSGKQVQRVHTLLARQNQNWVPLKPPHKSNSLTVCDVLNELPGVKRDNMLRNWMVDVYECWEHQHDWVRNISTELLYD
jgi:hypothetical protein